MSRFLSHGILYTRNPIPSSGSIVHFKSKQEEKIAVMWCHRPEYSPLSQWKESSDASVTVFRAEVSRFKALKDEADKANDRAHRLFN